MAFADPSDISGLTLWLDASDASTITSSGGNVTQWDDKSGSGNHLTQTYGGIYEPTTGSATQNSLNLIRFNGSPEFMDGLTYSDVTTSNDLTVFEVAGNRTSGSYGLVGQRFLLRSGDWWIDTSYSNASFTPAVPSGVSVRTYVLDYVADSHKLLIDGDVLATLGNTTPSSSSAEIRLADNFDGRNGIDAAEVVIYNRTLTDLEVNTVGAYLADKWGTTWSGSPGEFGQNTIVTDDFNRADGGVGANYSTPTGTAEVQVASNTAQGPTDATTYVSSWSADTFDNDQWAEADVTLGGTSSEGAVYVRLATGGAFTGYGFIWDTAASGTYRIVEVTAGSEATLGSSAGVGTTGTKTLRLEVVGTALTAYVDGVEVLTTTDATITAGEPGIGMYRSSGATATLDNFSAGDWAASSGPTGTSATTLVRHTGAGSGTTAAPPVTGTGAGVGARHTLAGSGSTTAPGATGTSATTLARHTATGSGSTGTTGTSTPTLARHTATGAGTTTVPSASGSSATTLARHTASGSGSTGTSGTGALDLVRHTAAGSGTQAPPGGTGTGAPVLGRHTASGSGSTTIPSASGSGSPTCTRHTATGTGSTGLSGSAGVTLIRHTATGAGATVAPSSPGTGPLQLARHALTGTGNTVVAPVTGTGTLLLERHTASGFTDLAGHVVYQIPAESRTHRIRFERRTLEVPDGT